MTIRDYLKHRTRLVMGAGFAGWLLLPVSAIVTGGRGPPALFFLLGFGVFAGAIVLFLFVVRCPKCNAPFGQLAGEIAFRFGVRRQVNYCPYCGVSMDEHYEAPREIR
jgi:hypothetical protein